MENRKRKIRLWFRVTPDELDMIRHRQQLSRITNREAFLRKMAIVGSVFVLEIPELQEISALLGHCSGNLNQIAKRVNTTGRYYEGELGEIKQTLSGIETELRRLLETLSES